MNVDSWLRSIFLVFVGFFWFWGGALLTVRIQEGRKWIGIVVTVGGAAILLWGLYGVFTPFGKNG